MSAIFGVWNINENFISDEYILKMKKTLYSYGRDSQDIYIQGNISLGCCLKKNNLISESEKPVYIDPTEKLYLVADSQIYNRNELIDKYALTNDERITDNGLLMAAYKKWGDECPKYINGNFSFAVWDEAAKKMVVVEDQLGVRPIYYFYNKDIFAFSTDYRALLAMPFVSKKLYDIKMYSMLSGQYKIEPDATYFSEIKALPQAHMLYIDSNSMSKVKYWTPGENNAYQYKSETECIKTLHSLIEDAIKIRLAYTDEKIGSEFSGGLDSSVITVLANRELKKENKTIESFSWSPPLSIVDMLENDEREFIEEICKREKFACTYLDENSLSDETENQKSLPPDVAGGEILCEEYRAFKSKGVGAVLCGWGGDQGISHRASPFELLLNGGKRQFFKEMARQSKHSPIQFSKLLISNTIMQFFGPFRYFGKPDISINNCINKDFAKKVKNHFNRDIYSFTIHPVKHVESGNIQTRTAATAWIGADYDILYLFPFLDYRVIDFALSVPRHFYYKNGVNRFIYRQAFKYLLSEKQINYTYKVDFARTGYYGKKRLEKNREHIRFYINILDRKLFSPYINFDKLIDTLEIPDSEKNLSFFRELGRSLRTCYYLQRLIENAEK